MSTKSRLDKLYKTCPHIRLPEDVNILFISDLHMGDGGPEDDFSKNEDLFCKTLYSYGKQNYFLVLLGDIYDIWEAGNIKKIQGAHLQALKIFNEFQDAEELEGNHDNSLNYPEGVVLQIGDKEIFCAHGMQGDWANDKWSWLGQFFVRYFWTPLQWIGLHDIKKAKAKRHELQEQRLHEWACDQSFISVFGHTHRLAHMGQYYNSGSWVYQGGEGIEYQNGQLTLKKF